MNRERDCVLRVTCIPVTCIPVYSALYIYIIYIIYIYLYIYIYISAETLDLKRVYITQREKEEGVVPAGP